MINLSVNLDETVGESFFYELDVLIKKRHQPCSLDEFIAMEMELYRKNLNMKEGCHCAA